MSDNLYYWTQLGSHGTRVLLGEVQCGSSPYNMGFSIDGLKDTAKLDVFSFDEPNPIKPYSVCWHEATDTWWIVNEDKVERIVNEVGYLYKHSIKLEGAIELLNARDLTDCGFYQNTYTTEEFIRRLFDLSTFEFGGGENIYISFMGNLDPMKIVDYVKSFENYTLLSALREFLDGYNCVAKLVFSQHSNTHKIVGCEMYINSRTGNVGATPQDLETTMKDPKGISRISKGSYGNCVISNADNVISTKSKIFPIIGYAKMGSKDFYLTPSNDNCVIRLPSKANSVEWVKMINSKTKCRIVINHNGSNSHYDNTFDPGNIVSYNELLSWVRGELRDYDNAMRNYVDSNYPNSFWADLGSEEILNNIVDNYLGVTFYDTTEYDPTQNTFISDKPINYFRRITLDFNDIKPYVLGNKTLRDGVQEPESVMYWERGSNEIRGFNFFEWARYGDSAHNNICVKDKRGYELLNFYFSSSASNTYSVVVYVGSFDESVAYLSKQDNTYYAFHCGFRVKYIPMTDIKIKYDNEAYGNDSKLYNQNGKYTDGVALSKSILSYKEEISSDTITRYSIGYSLSSMPKVGDTFTKDGVVYVVGNASYDFSQHEEDKHYIVGEYTLSKKIAIKTYMTNPNTNIRDYGIPQQFNVRRKQLYRDFYEVSYSIDNNADNTHRLSFDEALNLTYHIREYAGHTALIKIEYSHAIGGGGEDYEHNIVPPSTEWYFQVDSTYYAMKKSFYEVFDFQDNNIIGYDSQNITCGWDIRRVLEQIQVGSALLDGVNTPISYVDEKGKFTGVYLSVLNSTNLRKIWDMYITEMKDRYQTSDEFIGSMYNRCVFIPSYIYNASLGYYDYVIEDSNYNKDAIEVPVFEYSCQIDDSDNILVGDDIFNSQDDDLMYLYEARAVPSGAVNDNNWSINFSPTLLYKNGDYIQLTSIDNRKACALGVDRQGNHNNLSIRLMKSVSFDGTTAIYGTNVNANSWLHTYQDSVDLVIIRYAISKNYTTSGGHLNSGVRCELMFILRNAVQCPYRDNLLTPWINHYTLK